MTIMACATISIISLVNVLPPFFLFLGAPNRTSSHNALMVLLCIYLGAILTLLDCWQCAISAETPRYLDVLQPML
jgi:hypothetical protein